MRNSHFWSDEDVAEITAIIQMYYDLYDEQILHLLPALDARSGELDLLRQRHEDIQRQRLQRSRDTLRNVAARSNASNGNDDNDDNDNDDDNNQPPGAGGVVQEGSGPSTPTRRRSITAVEQWQQNPSPVGSGNAPSIEPSAEGGPSNDVNPTTARVNHLEQEMQRVGALLDRLVQFHENNAAAADRIAAEAARRAVEEAKRKADKKKADKGKGKKRAGDEDIELEEPGPSRLRLTIDTEGEIPGTPSPVRFETAQ